MPRLAVARDRAFALGHRGSLGSLARAGAFWGASGRFCSGLLRRSARRRLLGRLRSRAGFLLGHQVERGPPARRIDGRDDDRELVAEADPPPEPRPTSATPCSSLSKRSRASRRRAGRKPSNTSPKRTNSPAPMSPVTTPSKLWCQPSRRSRSAAGRPGRSPRRAARHRPPRARAASSAGDLRELPRLRGVLAETGERAGRAMHDDVGIAADRRREVDVGRRGERGMPDVDGVVARLLERAQEQRRERLARRRPVPEDRLEQLGLPGHRSARPPSPRALGERRDGQAERRQPIDELQRSPRASDARARGRAPAAWRGRAGRPRPRWPAASAPRPVRARAAPRPSARRPRGRRRSRRRARAPRA